MGFQEKDPTSEPVRDIVYGRIDKGNGQYGWIAIEATDNGNGLGTLKTSGASSGGSGTSNTVAPTAAGTSATTANPVQGVTNGVPFAVIGTFFQATQPVSLTSLPALAAGSNAIGTVGVTSLPALPAGNNAIGTVGVTALPALPTGSNAIGTVGVTALPALSTGSNTIGNIGAINSPLPTGTNALGTVGVTALPALSTGANTIGNVVPLMGGAAVTNANPFAVANIVGGAVVSATNPIPVINSGNTPTLKTPVAASTTIVDLSASDATLRERIFYNDSSTASIALIFAATGTYATATYIMPPLSGWVETVYTGIVRGIWSAANGTCRVTEVRA